MRKLLYAGLATLVLTTACYSLLPRPRTEQPTQASSDGAHGPRQAGGSEAAEAGSGHVVPVPSEVVEPIVVEQKGALVSIDGELVLPEPIAEVPAERMTPAPRPDGAHDRMPLADEEPMPGASEPQEATASPHEDACPFHGRCPVPHVSYPLPR